MAGNNATKSVITELAKRVPINQKKQFQAFMNLNAKYNERVNKYPEKLPTIDWEFYRTNVRTEAIKMVDEFEKKYEELNKVFDDRPKLDTKKYYDELEKQRAAVQAEVQQYIAESNERIKAYEAEIKRLCTMKPYSQMSMEEFITLRPEMSDYIPHGRKPLFWPHDPEEQIIGTVGRPKAGGSGGGGDGSGDDSGGGGGAAGQTMKPGDVAGKTAKIEVEETPKSAEVKATAAAPQVEEKAATTNPKAAEPQYHKDEPASAEARKKLDPCNLMGRQEQKAEDKVDKGAVCAESPTKVESVKPKTSEQPPETKTAVAITVENKAEPTQKKPHPCDLVKNLDEMQESVAKCTDASKSPYKDGKDGMCIFLDPCKTKFGGGIKSDSKEVEKVASKEKVKSKEPSSCAIKTTKAETEKDACKIATSYRDEKKGEKAGKTAGGAAKSKPETKCSKEPKKSTKSGDELKNAKSTSLCQKTEPQEPPKKSANSNEEEKKKAKVEAKAASSCQKTEPKEPPKKTTKPAESAKKPKCESEVIKDKDSCTMVFAETKAKEKGTAKEKAKKQEKKIDVDSCALTPYYNPFRSDEENKRKEREEDEMNDECDDRDPCSDEERNTKKDYYNPCKDDKEKK